MNAATGEVFIEDTKETVLGSAGHALELKVLNAPNTRNLKVILIEENNDCYEHLKKVVSRRWPDIPISEAESAIGSNTSNVHLLRMGLDNALTEIDKIKLGNSLFYFDPLRSVEYSTIENVARRRMKLPFRTGTEFFIFVFTSDWFLGRDDFAALPCNSDEDSWSAAEKETVSEADALFGDNEWRSHVLNGNSIEDRESALIELYQKRLHRCFRYVLPLPFNPKATQVFHLILCSNYEAGIRMTRNVYSSKTSKPKYSPDNKEAYARFKKVHPETLAELKSGKQRPLQWQILWRIIVQHEEGMCDFLCKDLKEIELNPHERQNALSWLADKGYLENVDIENIWGYALPRYKLNWKTVKGNLGVDPPLPLRPISPREFKVNQLIELWRARVRQG